MNPLLLNHLIGFSINVIVLAAIAILVYRSRPESILHRAFAGNQVAISWWSLFTIFMITSYSKNWGLFWDRMCLSGVVFIPATLLHYIVSFTRDEQKLRKAIYFNYFLSFVFLFFLWWTRLFVADVRPKFGMNYFTVPGPLYAVFVGIFVVSVILGLFFLGSYIRKAPNLRIKRQTQLLFWFSMVGYGGGVCNYLLVYDIKLPGVAETSNYAVLFLSLSLAYIIFKYKFLDIEVIIRRTLVFAGLLAFVFGVFSFSLFIAQEVLAIYFGFKWEVALAISIFLIVLGYEPMRAFLINVTDRFLFQKKYVYYKLLKENSKQIAFIHSLDELAKQIAAFLVKQGRIRNVAVFMQSDDGTHYVLKSPLGYGGKTKRPKMILGEDHSLIQLLKEAKGPLQTEELVDRIHRTKEKGSGSAKGHEEAIEILRVLKAEVAIPSFLMTAEREDKESTMTPRSILILGPKKSDQPYSEEDLDVFFTIAQDSAIAAENARLFDTVVTERESKLKAQNEAKMVSYARTIAHEIKNALVGIESPSVFFQRHDVEDLKQMFDRFIKGKAPPTAQSKYLDICKKIESRAKEIFSSAQTIRVIASTAQGTLKTSDDTFGELYFKILWEGAKENSRLSNCEYITEIPENFIIGGNRILLQRVFINLINNAVEAMAGQKEKRIELKCRYENEDSKRYAFFELSDNGPGIPADVLPRIFEQGFSTKPKPHDTDIQASGHGQGLYFCKEVIESIHKGRIEVESSVGKGTTFRIRLPLPIESKIAGA